MVPLRRSDARIAGLPVDAGSWASSDSGCFTFAGAHKVAHAGTTAPPLGHFNSLMTLRPPVRPVWKAGGIGNA